jgi:drug/metabolite transporter (DMT)-like permease
MAYRDNISASRLSVAGATSVIALTSVCFGLVPLFARELQALGVGPASIALYRYLFTALVMLPFLPLARGKRRAAITMGFAGLCMGLGWIGYLEAIETAPVAAAGVVYMSYPLFALLFAWLLLGQRPGPRAGLAALLILGGALVLFQGESLGEGAMAALLWSLPAPIGFGFIIVVLSGMTATLNPLERMASGMLGAILGLAPLAVTTEAAMLLPGSAGQWALVLAMGLVTALIPQFLYTITCPRVGAARAAAAGSFELPTMLIVGWLFFGEALGPQQAFAAALVLTAILLSPPVSAPPVAAPSERAA